ncbi:MULTISPECIES: hypothetical protein [unclassified Sulfurospirillum]|uniref:hypothetical protein n=1 Tax=unclassified Sulfurospirillum TaxID=2618290 RepID=UPI000504D2D2|nr:MULTISPECIES: hypothetical protein [unclassified Sulfurospirillum]KFL33537.1 hypothetical protein JU57_10140 [Sulfurospirillum sp. SCADC]
MKLSASINFFNGEELLWYTVKNIRPLVNHLSIVYQETSNWNEPLSDNAKMVIQKLKDGNLVDDFFCFTPNFNKTPAENEFSKRVVGLELAKKINATHFLLMDADEFYIPEQFEDAKKLIETEDITYSCVHSYFYLHKPYYRSETPDTTNVCFIAKITPELSFEYQGIFPAEMVDPTRRLINKSGKFKFFDADEISMHHMNFVRENFNSKLINTSSASNLEFINNAKKALTHWEWPRSFSFPNKPTYNIIKVEDRFHLDNIELKSKAKILLTNHFIREFSGSEIATLDLAKEFLSREYAVTVGTFTFADPLKAEFEKFNIRILDLNNATAEHFDLIWAQHFTTIDACLIDIGITADKIIFSSLSPYESLESPPLSTEKVDLFLANSLETKKTMVEMGLDDSMIEILPNPVSNDFFVNNSKKDFSLQKIAIVSNHIPSEIKEAIPQLENKGIEIKIFGMEGEFRLITPDVLREFDAIITIGRTVQYCLAMGIPVYCYDRFGGPGWIEEANFQLASEFNFSGRCTNRKISSDEIVTELIQNFGDMQFKVTFCRDVALKNYSLSDSVSKIMQKLTFTENKNPHHLFFNIAKRQHIYLNNNSKLNLFAQLFMDQGKGISEENSIKFPVVQNTQTQEFTFDLTDKPNIKALRLDPLNECCVIEIESLHVKKENETIDLMPHVHSNAEIHHGKSYFFTTDDSQMYFSEHAESVFENAQALVVVLRYAHVAKDALHVSVKQKNQELAHKEQNINALNQELISLYLSKRVGY